jgi:hypothetical protein
MGRVLDAVLVLLLAGAGAKVGADYHAASTSPQLRPDFYQTEFGPAVMQACGHGFVNPVPNALPALTQFITQERTTFDCAELPRDLKLAQLTSFQATFRYMMYVVAVYWKATRVSWDHLEPIFGAIHGVVVGLSYLAFRVVLARTLAVPLGLAIAFSPAQLSILPYLRDSNKTPFFMADALIVLLVWTRPLTTRTILLLCGLFGVVAGIGVGFRPDVVVWFPMLAIALFCARHESLRRRLRATAVGLAVSLGAFVLFGWPILAQYRSGSNFGHVAILGLTKPFDVSLGVQGGPYTRGFDYTDAYVRFEVNSYARRVHGYSGVLFMMTTDYERYASKYFSEMVRTFPADIATRLAATVAKVLNLAFWRSSYDRDAGIDRVSYLRTGVTLRNSILGAMDGWGFYIALAACALLAARGFALGCGFAATVLFLAGLPVLQFHLRHFSHLEFVGLFSLGLVIQIVATTTWRAVRRDPRDAAPWPPWRPALVRVAVCLGVLVLVSIVSIRVLRAHQQSSVTRLIDAYNAEAVEVVPSSIQPSEAGRVLVVPQGVPVPDRANPETRVGVYDDYLVVDLSDACDAMSLTMRIKYESNIAFINFTRDVPVKLWPAREYGHIRLFVPVYQFIDSRTKLDRAIRFQGLEFSRADLPCLAGLKRVPDSATAPLWLDLLLTRTWKDRPLYQTFADHAVGPSPDPTIYRSSPGLVLRSREVDALNGVGPDFGSVSKVAKVDHSSGVVVDGIAETPFVYLVQSKPRSVTAGTQVMAVGELFTGGFTLGLLKDGAWSQTLNVTTPGRFIAAVDASANGTYEAVIANINSDTTKPTRLVITGMGWCVR